MTDPRPPYTDADGLPSPKADRLAERQRDQEEAERELDFDDPGPDGYGWAPDPYEDGGLI